MPKTGARWPCIAFRYFWCYCVRGCPRSAPRPRWPSPPRPSIRAQLGTPWRWRVRRRAARRPLVPTSSRCRRVPERVRVASGATSLDEAVLASTLNDIPSPESNPMAIEDRPAAGLARPSDEGHDAEQRQQPHQRSSACAPARVPPAAAPTTVPAGWAASRTPTDQLAEPVSRDNGAASASKPIAKMDGRPGQQRQEDEPVDRASTMRTEVLRSLNAWVHHRSWRDDPSTRGAGRWRTKRAIRSADSTNVPASIRSRTDGDQTMSSTPARPKPPTCAV